MKNRKKLAGIALGVIIASGILGILGLAALGAETAAGTAAVLPHINLHIAFAALLLIMTASTVVMIAAIPKKK